MFLIIITCIISKHWHLFYLNFHWLIIKHKSVIKYISACDDGQYGENCREKCGECFGSNQCHYINGTCMDGCKSGYQEFNCKERMIHCYI